MVAMDKVTGLFLPASAAHLCSAAAEGLGHPAASLDRALAAVGAVLTDPPGTAEQALTAL